MNLWDRVRELDNETLKTDAQQKEFDVHVEDDRVRFVPHTSGKGRWTPRSTIEKIVNDSRGPVTMDDVKAGVDNGARNTSYIYALLTRLGMTA